jgi:hypothetical protein
VSNAGSSVMLRSCAARQRSIAGQRRLQRLEPGGHERAASGTGAREDERHDRLMAAQVGVGERTTPFVDQRERRDRVAALEARGRRGPSTGRAAPRPVTATSSATVGPDPTRSLNRTRSPGASRADSSSASVNAIVIAGM